jgi:hypothetical protein
MIRPNPITPAQYYMSRSLEEKRKFLKQYGHCYKLIIHQFYKFLNREPGGRPIARIPNHFDEKIYRLIKNRLNKKLKKIGWYVKYQLGHWISFSSPPIIFELV